MAPLIALVLAQAVLTGDPVHAQALFRMHCAGCHAVESARLEPTAVGKALGAPALRDPTLLASRSEDELLAVVLKGGPGAGSPAFKFLSVLDAADLVAFLRGGAPGVQDVFGDAAAYTAKSYALQGPAVDRAETLVGGELAAAEKQLTLFTVYGGDKAPLGPRLVPQEPLALDTLAPKQRKGWIAFGELPGPRGERVPVALALGNDFTVARLVAPGLDLSRLAPAVLGKGSREPGKRRAFAAKTDPERSAQLTRLYARAVEAAAIAFKEEADRHLFDPPESTQRSSADKERR